MKWSEKTEGKETGKKSPQVWQGHVEDGFSPVDAAIGFCSPS